jgi:DNA repair protein RecN (Recombination protein N)
MLCTPAALQLRLANARRRQPAQGECAERPLASPAPARPARRAAPRPAAALDASAAAAAPAAATGPATAADAAEVTHLRELRLENWALVEAATVSLRPGLTVLTGESGAGKSALVSALACLAGAPTAPEAVRPPADAAVVEGVFLLAPADRAAIARHLGMVQDLNASTRRDAQAAVMSGELRVRRETRRATDFAPARGRAFLNSTRTTLPALTALGAALVDVNAQHAATALGAAEAQLALLDRAAGTAAAAAGAAAALLRLRAAQRDYGALLELADPAERAARQALVDEVAAARVQPGEVSSATSLVGQSKQKTPWKLTNQPTNQPTT